jgi:membrane-associated phospholipid phosphatase
LLRATRRRLSRAARVDDETTEAESMIEDGRTARGEADQLIPRDDAQGLSLHEDADELVSPNVAESPSERVAARKVAARKLSRAEVSYAVALAVFAVLALFAHAYAYFNWDLATTRALQTHAGLLTFMRAVSAFGDSWHGWALAAFALVAFLARGRRTEAAALLVSVAGGELINRVVKWMVGRPRPVPALVHVSGDWARESFPSGHVTFYVCLFGFLFFVAYGLLHRGTLVRRVCLALCMLPVLLIGCSRIYLGAHWASDVLGAYLLSGVWLAFSLHLYRRWKARSTFHPDEQT